MPKTNATDYEISTTEVYGGYDLTISHQENSATLFIQDPEQATDLAQRIIAIAIKQDLNINSAFAIFNAGSAMFVNE